MYFHVPYSTIRPNPLISGHLLFFLTDIVALFCPIFWQKNLSSGLSANRSNTVRMSTYSEFIINFDTVKNVSYFCYTHRLKYLQRDVQKGGTTFRHQGADYSGQLGETAGDVVRLVGGAICLRRH